MGDTHFTIYKSTYFRPLLQFVCLQQTVNKYEVLYLNDEKWPFSVCLFVTRYWVQGRKTFGDFVAYIKKTYLPIQKSAIWHSLCRIHVFKMRKCSPPLFTSFLRHLALHWATLWQFKDSRSFGSRWFQHARTVIISEWFVNHQDITPE